jgi:hypothetical protein
MNGSQDEVEVALVVKKSSKNLFSRNKMKSWCLNEKMSIFFLTLSVGVFYMTITLTLRRLKKIHLFASKSQKQHFGE